MKPDLFILGDSHSEAIRIGAEALGLSCVAITIGGLHWHNNVLKLGGRFGLKATYGKRNVEKVRHAADALEVEDLCDPHVPVIGSFAFHLGQLITPLKATGFSAYENDATTGPSEKRLTVSSGFVDAYIDQNRSEQLRIAHELSKNTSLVMVRQPKVIGNETPNHRVFDQAISDRLGAYGVNVYDHRSATCDPKTGFVRPDLLEDDGGHGSAEFGKASVQDMLDKGLLDRPK
ncbi:hypothetical protein N9O61_05795 [Octadecabacter sp.]|nr:hypothetical protein [Octadecabacter sp.]